MSTELLFELDTSGEPSRRSSRMFYTTIGNLEITDDDIASKPSQERPAILKCKAKRYHEQDALKKFQPGKLSYKLREALGLRIFDIPEHIYRMRHLGYPPGWLKKAEVKTDSITIFGANNNVINGNQNKKDVKYDCEKLHEYPGFNSRKSYDSRYDYCAEKGFIPMQDDCLLANFRNFLRQCQLLGKEETDISMIRSSNSVRNSATDFNLPPPTAAAADNPLKRKQPDATSTPRTNRQDAAKRARTVDDNDDDDANWDELEDGEQLSEGEVVDDEEGEEEVQSVANASSPGTGDLSAIARPPQGDTEDGTMLLVSSATEKPSLERFSEGINEHRLFENLPNAGGTYQKVRDVLKKVRV